MSALKRYWTLGKLVKDDGKSVFSEDWVGVMKAADVEAVLMGVADILIGGIPLLEEQLAARTQERDDEKEVRNCVARNSALLEQQLATAQARATKLEEALKQAKHDTWIEASHDLRNGLPNIWKKPLVDRCVWKAQQALREEGDDV